MVFGLLRVVWYILVCISPFITQSQEKRTMSSISISSFSKSFFPFSPAEKTWHLPSSYSNGVNFFTQTTIGHTPGAELVPYQVGSNILHITNVADPVRDPVDSTGHDSGAHDPGKLSFVWGSQVSWFYPGCPAPHMIPSGLHSIFLKASFTCTKKALIRSCRVGIHIQQGARAR